MRLLAVSSIVPVVVACAEPRLAIPPLPELVVAQVPAAPISVPELLLVPGESWIWDVRLRGVGIGRAELDVGEQAVQSRFKTGMLASAIAAARHELATGLDRGAARPLAATEMLELGGEAKRFEVAFGPTSYVLNDATIAVPPGGVAHTMHTALGTLRAWAHPGARAGFLVVLHAGELVRIELQPPHLEASQHGKVLRIDGRVRTKDEPLALTMWLTANPARTPVRIEIAAGKVRITAELIETLVD